jgi:hypothetical protein
VNVSRHAGVLSKTSTALFLLTLLLPAAALPQEAGPKMVDQMADYLLRSTTGAKILMLDRFSLVMSFQIERNSRPPEGVEPNDLFVRTGFVFDF